MMTGSEESDPSIGVRKPTNKAEQSGGGAGGAKGGSRGECGSAKHAPGAEPSKRGTGAEPRTGGGKEKKEGTAKRQAVLYPLNQVIRLVRSARD